MRFFQSLLREDAIEFYQSIRITTETTLTGVLNAFRREFAKEDQQEVARFKFNKLTYDPKTEQFPDVLKNLKKIGKQAFGDRSQELVEAMLFGKLPIQIQSQLTLAGKRRTTTTGTGNRATHYQAKVQIHRKTPLLREDWTQGVRVLYKKA